MEIMRQGGQILHDVFEETIKIVNPGVTTEQIDKLAEKLIRKKGAEPAFQRVSGYRWTTCICINEQVVHTPPSGRKLQNGDIVTIDMGVFYKGFNTDKADTMVVGKTTDDKEAFLAVGKKTLHKALQQVKTRNRIGNISKVIQENIMQAGYYVIRDLTGHGIGPNLHEDPFVPGVLTGSITHTAEIRPGMALAIEIIYAQKKTDIIEEKKESWSLITKNGSIAACFEETVAIYENKASILT